jgi:S1-C subfamily serine protease
MFLKTNLQHLNPVFLFILIICTGCATAYQYNGITYPDSYQALNAQKNEIKEMENSIISAQETFRGTAKIILPSINTIKTHGVVRGPLAQELAINYIVNNLQEEYLSFARSLKKRNLFESLKIDQRDNTIDPELNGENFLIWLEVRSIDSWVWYIKSNDIGRQNIIIDPSLNNRLEKMNSWLGSIENLLKTKYKGTRKNKNFKNAEIAEAPGATTPNPAQSRTGSGFFVSKMGHVITNAHVVKGCKKVTVGDDANKQVKTEIINVDGSNDLALLKLTSLKLASTESQSFIQKLGIAVVPLASKGLLRLEDVKLGEIVLVAGYPFGDVFSNTIKVTAGIVSATRGAGDDSGQFQLDAAVQPGNSGGPIYDSSGNVVGVVVYQLNKLKIAKAIGSMPENVNFGIKASTVRQFLASSGLPSKKSERTEKKSTEQLAEIAQNQTLMVLCFQ